MELELDKSGETDGLTVILSVAFLLDRLEAAVHRCGKRCQRSPRLSVDLTGTTVLKRVQQPYARPGSDSVRCLLFDEKIGLAHGGKL